jgi:uncharacterized membrane protein YcaP (DUF421 family)
MNKEQRVRVRTGAPLTDAQQASDRMLRQQGITLLGDVDIASTQQGGNLTDAQKAQLKSQIDHLRAQMHDPSTLNEIVCEPLAMLGIE